MDSVGCGALEDYKRYHNTKANTLLSVYKNNPKLQLPNLEQMGISKILFNTVPSNNYCAGKIRTINPGNDTLSSTWEIMGIIFSKRFRSVKKGFSQALIKNIEKELGTPLVGNEYIASKLAFNKYYQEHAEKRCPIIYTADDGVVLLSAHAKIIDPKKLNALGKKLADLLATENVVRVITRSFTGTPNNFVRSKSDQYFPVLSNLFFLPILNELRKHGVEILTTEHIYNTLGKSPILKNFSNSATNKDVTRIIDRSMKQIKKPSLIIACSQDFDKFGHAKDPIGYGKSLKQFDDYLPKLIRNMLRDDLLIITSDHGCDPTKIMRGHTREFVPLLFYYKNNNKKIWLDTRNTFADIGQTICYNFDLKPLAVGTPVYELF